MYTMFWPILLMTCWCAGTLVGLARTKHAICRSGLYGRQMFTSTRTYTRCVLDASQPQLKHRNSVSSAFGGVIKGTLLKSNRVCGGSKTPTAAAQAGKLTCLAAGQSTARQKLACAWLCACHCIGLPVTNCPWSACACLLLQACTPPHTRPSLHFTQPDTHCYEQLLWGGESRCMCVCGRISSHYVQSLCGYVCVYECMCVCACVCVCHIVPHLLNERGLPHCCPAVTVQLRCGGGRGVG
jgi:hypothetical protein